MIYEISSLHITIQMYKEVIFTLLQNQNALYQSIIVKND